MGRLRHALAVLIRKLFIRRCPAVAFYGNDDYPRCDREFGHGGNHKADRGMYLEEWTEVRVTGFERCG